MAWRGIPALVALLALGALWGVTACGDTGPSPIGDHAPDDVDSGDNAAKPSVDASDEGGEDAAAEAEAGAEDAGEDADTDNDADAGDAGDADAGKDAHS